jgi:hypothetical protein
MTNEEIKAGCIQLEKFAGMPEHGLRTHWSYPQGEIQIHLQLGLLKDVAEALRKRIPASFWTLDSPSVGAPHFGSTVALISTPKALLSKRHSSPRALRHWFTLKKRNYDQR